MPDSAKEAELPPEDPPSTTTTEAPVDNDALLRDVLLNTVREIPDRLSKLEGMMDSHQKQLDSIDKKYDTKYDELHALSSQNTNRFANVISIGTGMGVSIMIHVVNSILHNLYG